MNTPMSAWESHEYVLQFPSSFAEAKDDANCGTTLVKTLGKALCNTLGLRALYAHESYATHVTLVNLEGTQGQKEL